jgi:hypothetical protein
MMTIEAVCPVDGLPDSYRAELSSPNMISVERIIAAAAEYKALRVFQEDMTAALARTLGCSITTIGDHSGVATIVSAP